LQQIYQSAASVANQTGVDPAIVTALAQTEGPTGANAPLLSLGITTGAPSGKGSGGASLPSATPGAAAVGQPSAFWAYGSGAEASAALANYINQGPLSGLRGFLGNATAFFQNAINTNYYVPMAGGQSKASYWNQKVQAAQQFTQQYSSLPGVLNPSPPADITGQIPGTTTVPGQTTVTMEPGTSPSGGGGSSGNPASPTFTDSLVHLLVTVGLVIAAIVLAILGAMFMTHSRDGGGANTTIVAPRGGEAAEAEEGAEVAAA